MRKAMEVSKKLRVQLNKFDQEMSYQYQYILFDIR
jgi:hypothetical protein